MNRFLAAAVGVWTVAIAGPAAAQSWQVAARSQARLYLVDSAAISTAEDISTVRVASVDRTGAAGNYEHTIETYEVRCGARQWRPTGMTEFGSDGTEGETFPEADSPWEAVRPGGYAEAIKEVACDGARPGGPTFESIKAYIDAGRP